MEDKDWDTLLEKIEMGACTPFIGAGASRPTLPGGAELAESLLREEEERSGKAAPLRDRTDLAKVTQYLAAVHEDGLLVKARIAKRILGARRPDFQGEPDEPHRVLAELPIPVYLTTNYDDYMFRALESVGGKTPRREVCRWNQPLMEEVTSAFDSGFEPTNAAPVVFHLHGRADLSDSLVVTEDDYLEFLVNAAKDMATSASGQQRIVLPTRIRRAITNSTLLFVGYSLGDINFRVLLRGLVGSAPRHIRIAVQYVDQDESAAELKSYLEKYFRWTLDVKVYFGSSREFAAELRRRWGNRK